MKSKKKNDMNIKTITLAELESRIKDTQEKHKEIITRIENNIKDKNLNKGRIRPKDPDEEKILERFKRKK